MSKAEVPRSQANCRFAAFLHEEASANVLEFEPHVNSLEFTPTRSSVAASSDNATLLLEQKDASRQRWRRHRQDHHQDRRYREPTSGRERVRYGDGEPRHDEQRCAKTAPAPRNTRDEQEGAAREQEVEKHVGRAQALAERRCNSEPEPECRRERDERPGERLQQASGHGLPPRRAWRSPAVRLTGNEGASRDRNAFAR